LLARKVYSASQINALVQQLLMQKNILLKQAYLSDAKSHSKMVKHYE